MLIIKGKEKEFQEWYNQNSDPYGRGTFDFAIEWAELMEEAIANGEELKDVAMDLSHKADEEFGISGFMYGCAVSVLSKLWVHGEELRIWHNLDTQVGNEGEGANKSGGVLNPALLNIGK